MLTRSWKRREITVFADNEDFPTIRRLIENCLQEENIDELRISEFVLLVEEIFVRAVDQLEDNNREITVTVNNKINEIYVDMSFDGPRFRYDNYRADSYDIGAKIISKYEDKIGVSYRRGRNTVTVVAARIYDKVMLLNKIAALGGILLGIYLYYFAGDSARTILNEILTSIQDGFCTAVLMISTPVTFFSFVTNITNSVVLADRRINLKNLIKSITLSSILALLIGAVYGKVLGNLLSTHIKVKLVVCDAGADILKEAEQIIPKDLFSAFTSSSPFPIICLAIVTAIAISTMNTHFNEAKNLNDTITGLFCQVLSIIYTLLPLCLFVSFAYIIYNDGLSRLAVFIIVIAVCLIGLFIMIVVNCIRLKLHRINPLLFIKTCMPAFNENYKINSPIDAIPYNIRFCNKYLGVRMRYLESAVPIVSHLNLDGNCFLLTMFSTAVLMIAIPQYEIITVAGLIVIIFGLSLGAPNQPGSLMIGLIVAMSFLGDATDMFSMIIVIEAFISRILTIINTMGNLTTVMIEATEAEEIKACQ